MTSSQTERLISFFSGISVKVRFLRFLAKLLASNSSRIRTTSLCNKEVADLYTKDRGTLMSLGCVEKPLHDGSRDVAEYHGTYLAFKVWRRCQRALQCSLQERGFPPHRLEIISLCVLEDFDNRSCRIFALLLRVNQAFSVTIKWFSLWVITGEILAKVQMPSAMFAEHLH